MIPVALVAPVAADPDVQAVLGNPPAWFMEGERQFQVNSMRWQRIANPEGENWEEALIQIDWWVRRLEDSLAIARALRRLLHHDTPITVGGERLWSQYVDSRPLNGARDGTIAESMDFRLTFGRSRYVA